MFCSMCLPAHSVCVLFYGLLFVYVTFLFPSCACSWIHLILLSLSLTSFIYFSSFSFVSTTVFFGLGVLTHICPFLLFYLNVSLSLSWSSISPSSTYLHHLLLNLGAWPPPAVTEPQEIDLIYQVLKQAGEISSSRSGTTRALTPAPPAAASVKQSEQPNGTGSTAPNVGSFHRRSGPTQQQPLLLRGAASSLTVGPVPHASISGVFVPSMFQCSWC